MADKNASFDVTTSVDLQEVDNAVNQADKEIVQRFDFKGAKVSIEFKRVEGILILLADSDMRLTALYDVLYAKLIKRGVPVRNLDVGDAKPAGGDTLRQEIKLKMALDSDTAKKVAASYKKQREVRPLRIDIHNEKATAKALKGTFGVIGAVQHQLNLSLMNACLGADAHYGDLGGLFAVFRQVDDGGGHGSGLRGFRDGIWRERRLGLGRCGGLLLSRRRFGFGGIFVLDRAE